MPFIVKNIVPILMILLFTRVEAYTKSCYVYIPHDMTFADVSDVEGFLKEEVNDTTCDKIEINGSIKIDCSTKPISLNFTGTNIDKIDFMPGIVIMDCPSVQIIEGFNQLDTLGSILVAMNDALQTVGGFSKLTIADYIIIKENDSLINILKFPKLREGTRANAQIRIETNRNLQVVEGFPNLTNLSTISFSGNYSLTRLPEFPMLKSLSYLLISGNHSIRDIGSFSELISINNLLYISNNHGLSIIDGFENLEVMEEGRLEIASHKILEKIQGFEKLKYVGSDLIIHQNYKLNSVLGFPNLCSIGSFKVSQNPVLKSIEIFPKLTKIEKKVQIERNRELKTIGGVSQLCMSDGLTNKVLITENSSMENCCVLNQIITYNLSPTSIVINNNGSDCEEERPYYPFPIPISSCIMSDIEIKLNKLGEAYLTTCDLIDGPTCSYFTSIDNIPFNSLWTFTVDDIGRHKATVKHGDDAACEITIIIKT